MLRFLGFGLTKRALALRIARATASFIIFYYITSNLNTIAKLFTSTINLSEFFTASPLVPVIGLGITISYALGSFFRKTRA